MQGQGDAGAYPVTGGKGAHQETQRTLQILSNTCDFCKNRSKFVSSFGSLYGKIDNENITENIPALGIHSNDTLNPWKHTEIPLLDFAFHFNL